MVLSLKTHSLFWKDLDSLAPISAAPSERRVFRNQHPGFRQASTLGYVLLRLWRVRSVATQTLPPGLILAALRAFPCTALVQRYVDFLVVRMRLSVSA